MLAVTAMVFGVNAFGNQHYEKDVESIKKMTGCYEVTFQNAETFSLTPEYKYHDRFKAGPALEWIFVDSQKEGLISLQHLLIAGPHIIKHWRQEWSHQNTSLYHYEGDKVWTPKELSSEKVDGMWTQKVYQVDDSPRYECSAPWIRYSGKNYWECETNAPLPRREFSKRSDYNILKRTNKHELVSNGHIHDQDNIKVVRKNGVSRPLVMEKGLNTYKLVSESRCQKAKDWWKQHKGYWFNVRQVWDEVYGRKDTMKFRSKVEGKTLWKRLFDLDEQFSKASNDNSGKIRKEVKSVIEDFMY